MSTYYKGNVDLSALNSAVAKANQAAVSASSAAKAASYVPSSMTSSYGGSSSTTNSTSRTDSSSRETTRNWSETNTTSKSSYDNYKDYMRSRQVEQAKKDLNDWMSKKPEDYKAGDRVTAAQKALEDYLNQRPGAYESKYQGQIDDLLNQILNRDAFSYDFNSDPIYQMYRQQYQQQGEQAMRNTSAYNAANLTGGYGSSYAATAGNLAYQQNLDGLNDLVPELYDRALQKYQAEGDTMRQNLSALGQQEEMAYGQYRDTVGDWQDQRDYLNNQFWNEQNFDYGQYRDTVSDWQNMRDFLAEQYGEEYARDFEKWAKEIELGGQTTTTNSRTDGGSETTSESHSTTNSSSTTNTSEWSNNSSYKNSTGSSSSGSSSSGSSSSGSSSSGSSSSSSSKSRGYDSTLNEVARMARNGFTASQAYERMIGQVKVGALTASELNEILNKYY